MTVMSKVVPTEYDVSKDGKKYILSDDRGREFKGRTLEAAFRRAERGQDPQDPIHHEPYPHACDVPAPARRRRLERIKK